MKYQIYLNKDTSILINELAEKNAMKPASIIKQLVEGCMRIARATTEETEKVIKDFDNEQRKI